MKAAPRGWAPHKVEHRLDGWTVLDPADETRIPVAVARLIAEALPSLGGRDAVAVIRARMQARQHEYDRKMKVRIARQHMLERVKKAAYE
jgi:hypothetical protein